MAVEHAAGGSVRARTHHHRRAWGRAAKVEVAVLEARLLANGDVLVDRERRRRGGVQHHHRGPDYLHLARGEVGVGRAVWAQAHLTSDLNDELVAQFVRNVLAQHHLCQTRGVAQVDERHPAVIAAPSDPTGERHGGAGVGGAEGTCEVGAEHG